MEVVGLKPTFDRVIVRRDDQNSTSRGGIIIPDSAKKKEFRGVVVAVGPGRRVEGGEVVAPCVNTGDRVLFSNYTGTDIKIDGKEYTILGEQDILAIESSHSDDAVHVETH